MPYAETRRLYHIFGKKIARYFLYKRAKRLYNEINRGLSVMESKMIRLRNSHA